MSKTIKINLSSQSIDDLVKRLKVFKKNFSSFDEKITTELSNLALQEIQQNYSNSIYTDGNNDVGFFITGSNNKKKVGVTGSQVLYNEFGTGTEGENNPHPEKGEFGLNAYNSGKTIRRNNSERSSASALGIPNGGLYWTYMEDNVKKYTQGIPAGKQVYLAAKAVQKQKSKIVKKVVGDALSKL